MAVGRSRYLRVFPSNAVAVDRSDWSQQIIKSENNKAADSLVVKT